MRGYCMLATIWRYIALLRVARLLACQSECEFAKTGASREGMTRIKRLVVTEEECRVVAGEGLQERSVSKV
jgi:hypothetical protein